MGQGEIIEVLESSKVALTSREIAEQLQLTEDKVCRIINRLLKFNEVKAIELPKEISMKFYKVKRRVRLFYV